MKKLLLLLLSIFVLFPLNVNAEVSGSFWNLDDLVENGTLQDFQSVDTIDITSLKYVEKLSELSNLKHINIKGLQIFDASFLNLDYQYESLIISSSLVDVTNLESNSFKEMIVSNSYAIGNSEKFSQYDWINSELLIEKDYDDEFTEIAKSIYKEGMSNEEIIKAVTLYVVNFLEPDNSISGTTAERVLAGTGVCGDYAYFESQLLNKLGIFALAINGYTDPNNIQNSGHAWVVLYLDNKWYFIDPSVLDNNKWNGKHESPFYMADISNGYNSDRVFRYPDFDISFIPTKYLQTKMSILNDINGDTNIDEPPSSGDSDIDESPVIGDNSTNNDTSIEDEVVMPDDSTNNNEEKEEVVENPNTGIFNQYGIIIAIIVGLGAFGYFGMRKYSRFPQT